MEQEDSKGTENPPEVPSSPLHSEKDNIKKDATPTEGSGKPEPEASSKPEPEACSKPEPEGSTHPEPEQSSKPDPEGSTQPAPAGSTQSEPKGSTQPEPEGSSLPEPSDKKTPQSLKAKSKILKKSKVVNAKTKGSRQILGKKQDNSRKDTIPPEGSNKHEPEGSSKPDPQGSTQAAPEGSTQPEPEGSTQAAPEGSSQPESSDKKTPRSLKAKPKILKKPMAVKVKTNGSRQICGKKEDNGKKETIPSDGSSKPEPEQSSKPDPERSPQPAPEGSTQPEPSDKNTPRSLKAKPKILKKPMAVKVTTNGSEQNLRKRRKRKNKKAVRNTDEPPKDKSLRAEESKEKESQNKSTNDKIPIIQKRPQAGKNKNVELDKSEQKRRNNEKHRESDRGASSRADKAKRSGMVNTGSSEKKREKLGGFIFMCSGKTKPDCFRYRVMGVTASKKDVVLGVKPGMKLFLYDFDLKLLYGIYKASSSGGMKLEPRAFGGNFPAQVRFSVDRDCFPLPESIFRKAIKENYNERHKFKTELTVRQVRKLTELFRPVEVHSALPPVYSPPKAIIREKEDRDDARASRSHLHRERAAGDPYNVLSHERDPRVERQEEIPRNLFLTEKSYRAYGLQGDGRNVASASLVNPIMEPYRRDYERDHLHHQDPIYSENVPARVESLHADPRHLNESEHWTYFRGAISDRVEDPYHAYRYGASPRDPYLPPLSREDISLSSYGGRTSIGADNLQRRETVHDRHYSAYSAADAFADFDRAQQYHREKPDATSLPVSSRYSFGGPSYSLR